jgi:hypothetical protein
LHDALGDQVGVLLLLAGVRQELLSHGLRADARGHAAVTPVAQHTSDLGGEGLVQ